jgi:hypothetical protein
MPSSPSPTFDSPPESSGPSVPARRHVLPFDPRRDGFAFTNSFRWTDEDLGFLARELRPLLRGLALVVPAAVGAAARGRRGLLAGAGLGALAGLLRVPDAAVAGVARRWSSFGLCGGMALAAAERWPHRAGLETAALQPEYVRPLLRRRQARTVRAAWGDFLRWWLRSRVALGQPLAAAEALDRAVARIRAGLDAGRPVVVGLAGDAPDPFSLHQVVAFGYEEEGPVTTFLVYDPNAPGRTRHLRAWTADGRAHVATDLPTGPKGRGGFHIHRQPGRVAMLFAVEPV